MRRVWAPDTDRHSDLRDIVEALWDEVGSRRFLRYVDDKDPAFMDNDMKAAAERAWRISGNVAFMSRRPRGLQGSCPVQA
jgi:hypothetical protein